MGFDEQGLIGYIFTREVWCRMAYDSSVSPSSEQAEV